MRHLRKTKFVILSLVFGAFAITASPIVTCIAQGKIYKGILKDRTPKKHSELPDGLTQTLTPEQWKIVDAKRAKAAADKLIPIRALTNNEMNHVKGGGYRNKYFAGTLPWQKDIRGANLSSGNLFKSFTDIQVAPGKGAGLAMQRTYNSMDDRMGQIGRAHV